MNDDDSVTSPPASSTAPPAPVPCALYESNGTIFEVYQGEQAIQPVVMRWKRLKTVTITREDNCSFDVHINQGRRDFVPK